MPVFSLSQRTVWETLCSDCAVIGAQLNATVTVHSTLTQEQAGMHPSGGSSQLNPLVITTLGDICCYALHYNCLPSPASKLSEDLIGPSQ